MAEIVIYGDAIVRKEYEDGYIEAIRFPEKAKFINVGKDFADCLPHPLNKIFGDGPSYFKYNAIEDRFYIFTVYEIIGEDVITDEYIAQLIDYTTGQWSDGICEGFEQWPAHTDVDSRGYFEVYASMWHRNQEVEYYFK